MVPNSYNRLHVVIVFQTALITNRSLYNKNMKDHFHFAKTEKENCSHFLNNRQ